MTGHDSDLLADAVTRLTERERAVLRLVAQGLESKEIAPRFDVSPKRVDKIAASASAKLGVARRKEAARLFLIVDSATEPGGENDSPGQSPPLMPDPLHVPFIVPDEAAREPSRVEEAQTPFTLELGAPLRSRGRKRNDLNMMQRAIWVALLACVGFSAFGLLALGLSTLSAQSAPPKDAPSPTTIVP